MRHLAAALTALTWAATGFAADAQSEYRIDPGHTHVVFSVERFGFADTIGVFPESDGVLYLDVDNPENSRVEAHVEAASLWSGLAARDAAVRGPSWLNADAFPFIAFRSTAVELIGHDRAAVDGELSLLGVTRPVRFDAVLNRIGPDVSRQGLEGVGMTITGQIDRTDFGLDTATALVGTSVDIRIELLAHLLEPGD